MADELRNLWLLILCFWKVGCLTGMIVMVPVALFGDELWKLAEGKTKVIVKRH